MQHRERGSNPSANPGLVADCRVLLEAKEQLGGTLSWSAQIPMSQWEGVTLGGNPSRVTKLILDQEGLSGRIPANLGALSRLTHLNHRDVILCLPVPDTHTGSRMDIALDLGQWCARPGKPDAPRLTGASGRTLLAAWSPPTNTGPPITGYDLEYRRDGTIDSYTLSSYTSSARLARITGLALDTLYEVRVRARNRDRFGRWSELNRASTLDTPVLPGSMSRPQVTAGGRTLRVTWAAPANTGPPIIGYVVAYRRRGSSASYTERSYGSTTTSATIWVSSNTTYEVLVRANNADGSGPWSPVVQATTSRVRPGKPAAPEVLPGGRRSVRVTWSAPRNSGPSISDYDVQYREVGSGDAFSDAGFNGTTRETTISGLMNGTRYEVQVRAKNRDGTGSWSESGVGKASVAVEFGSETYTATEGGAGVGVTVTLNESAVAAVTIPITVTAGTRTEEGDYRVSGLSGGSVTFAIGESSRTLTVTANEDGDSADESVELGLGTLPDAVGAGTRSTALVALADNDPLTVELSGPGEQVDGPFEVTVTFSEEVAFDAGDVTVSGATVSVAGSGAHYTATVTPSGPGTVTVEVAAGAVQDDAGNGNEASRQVSVTVPLTCATGSAVPDRATNAGLVSDCRVLLAAKDELAGTESLNWSVGVAMSTWEGVTIRGTPGRVARVRLGGRELNGRIPAELSELAQLAMLDLSNNDIGGSIPSELGSLAMVQLLYLDDNELDGRIPPELGSLANLTHLRLQNNELSGSIPSELGRASDLRLLRVSNNDLSGNFPHELANPRRLYWLSVSGNRLSGCVPAVMRPRSASYHLGALPFCDEGPGKPDPPTVTVASTSAVTVSWSEPVNTGETITGYDIQSREQDSGEEFADAGYSGTGTETTIGGLTGDTRYEVQVRARSADGTSPWSESGVGATAAATAGFGSESYTATEAGNGVPVTVMLNPAALEALAIPITVRPAALTEASDYSVSARALTFAVGESTRTLTVTALADDDSADEAVELGFGQLPPGVVAGAAVTAAVTLSDVHPLTLELSGPSGTADGPFEVTVRFSEEIVGFDAADVTVAGGTVAVSGSGAQYAATVTPSASGTVTVEVVAGAVQDGAGNDNEASAQLRVTVQLTCASGVAVANSVGNPGLVGDCRTLLAAKQALAGTGSLNWSADEAIGDWDGVTTGATPERVTELRLAGRGLDGELPAGLSGLSGLTALDVSNNAVSGGFPSALGSLSALRELQVQDTGLTGCVPEALRARLDGTLSDLGHLRYCDQGPDKPSRLTVVVEGPSTVAVQWEQPPSGREITGYDVQHGVSGDGVVVVASHPASSRTARITELLPGRSYSVQVRATTDEGAGPWSDAGEGETASLSIAYGAERYTANEGAGGVPVTVMLNPAALEALAIPITVRPAALTEASDYSVSARALTFAVGESSRTLTVTALADDDSADEAVELGFGQLPPGVVAGAAVTAAVTLSDVHPLTLELSGPSGTADGPFEVTVRFSEEIVGFDAADVTVAGGTVAVSGSGAQYAATVTPSASGTVTVEVVAGAVQDGAGNDNEASAQLRVTVQLTCASGVAVANSVGNPGLVGDCRTLLAAKQALAGTGSLNWSADEAIGDWDGVTTGATPERVTELRLPGRGLDGALPAGLSGLSGLTALDVSNNAVSGGFPSALGSLSALRELQVQDTGLTGCVPEVLRARLDGALSDLGHLRYCDQGPGRPEKPTVRAVGSSVVVAAWSAPESRVAITDYDVRYRVAGAAGFTDADHVGAGILTTITGLLPGRSYEVQVRASSAHGTGPWSESGSARTAALTVSYGADRYTAGEGGSGVPVTVSLSAAAVEEVAIPLDVSPGALTEPGDYALSARVLTFAVGESSRTLTVTANGDDDSADEAVELGFGELPLGVEAGGTVTAVVALTDDDPLTVEVSGPAGTVDGAFDVTVSFSEEVTGFVPADVAVAGGTVAVSGSGAHYVARVTPTGSGTVTVQVPAGVVQDDAGNGNEASARLSVPVRFDCGSGVAVVDPGANRGLVSDCEALLAAKEQLAGTATLNWSADVAMSSWDGVRVPAQVMRVTRLELRSRELDGTVPAALGRLAGLLRLDLGDNGLSGSIPEQIGDLRSLRRLYLDGNELSGVIPGEIGDLTELKRLWLSDNDLSGRVPGELGTLTELIELYLQGNRLSGCVPSALGSIPSSRRDFGELTLCNAGPGRPDAPSVTVVGPSSLSVSWTEPPATGVTIDGYEVRYREVGGGAFSSAATGGTGTTATITGLLSGRSYEVQVRASAGEQSGPWSPSGHGRTETLQVTFGPGPFTAAEGGAAATVTVGLSAVPAEEIRIPIRVRPAGTAKAADYTAGGLSGGQLIFASGRRTASITVEAGEDDDSADEEVLLEFGLLPRSVSAGTLTTARVTLTDNDAAPLTVSFAASTYTATEGGAQVTIPVRLSQPALREVRVPIVATPRGTTAAGDYMVSGLASGALVFAVGSDTRYLRIAAAQDTDAADEAVALVFGQGVPAGAVATAEVQLDDDDTEPLTVSFAAAAYTAAEGATGVAVTVELSQGAPAALSVPITVQGRAPTASGDYEVSGLSADGALSFAPGNRIATVTVTAVDDEDGADEAVVLGFGAGLPAGARARAVVTLQDDEDGEGVSYGAARYRVGEGGVLSVTVRVVPTPATATRIPVTVTPSGSTAATDYLVLGLTAENEVSISAGSGTGRFFIAGQADPDDADEELALGFGALPAGLTAGAVAFSAQVTIVDSATTVPRVRFQTASVVADEGNEAVVTVELTPAPAAAVEVPITATPRGTTTHGDYAVSGLADGMLTIAAGRTTAAFTMVAHEDTDAADEVVELGFGELPDGTSAGVEATSEVVLRDNDTSALALSYGADTFTAVEGSIAVAVVVHLSQAAQSDLAAPVTVTPRGTTAAGDYAVSGLAEDGTLAFAEGARSRTLMVTAVEDADAANEAVVLGFGGGVVPAGDPAVAVITLQDNDTTALNVQFGAASYTAVERGAAAAVTVSLNQPAPRGLAIPVTVSLRGTTQTGDYTVAGLDTAGALAFAAGERSKTVTVTANDDADAATEQVVLGFGGVVPPGAIAVTVVSLQEAAAGGGTRAGARARADRPQVSFVATEYEIAEGTSAVVTVRLSAPLEESVAVPITAQPRGATQADDYTREGLTDGALAFDAGAVEQTFTVRANHDADGRHETVVLGFGTLPDSVTAGRPATATVRIEDDEAPVMERITRVNRALVPHLAQAATASTIDAIGSRVAAAWAAGAGHAAFDTAGLERLSQAVAARDRAGAVGGAAQLPGVEQVLGDTAFTLPVTFGEAAGHADYEPPNGSSTTVWGAGDYRSLGGSGDAGVAWDGALFSAHLGFDAPLGHRLLAGVALSWSRGAFEYRDRSGAGGGRGTHRSWTVSAHPYVSWSPLEALGLWATAGYGAGPIEVNDEAADMQSSDMRRIAAAGGVQATLSDERLLPGGTTSLTARGEGAYTWHDVTGRGLIEPLAVQVWRGRLAVEGSHERLLPWGGRIRPALEVGVRYDGGRGMAGAGVEIGGGLTWAEPWGLQIEGRGRLLAAHQSGYREWAAGGRVSLDLRRDGQGLSVSVTPGYGQTASGVRRLWQDGVAHLTSAASRGNDARASVAADVRYGIPFTDGALFTPYGGIAAIDNGALRYHAGGKLEFAPAFSLDLRGEHAAVPAGTVEQRISIEGTVRF